MLNLTVKIPNKSYFKIKPPVYESVHRAKIQSNKAMNQYLCTSSHCDREQVHRNWDMHSDRWRHWSANRGVNSHPGSEGHTGRRLPGKQNNSKHINIVENLIKCM